MGFPGHPGNHHTDMVVKLLPHGLVMKTLSRKESHDKTYINGMSNSFQNE